MPATNMKYTEDDISELVRNDVRKRHKLNKDHEVQTLVVIDRDSDGENPVVTIETSFEQEVASESGKKK